MSENKKHKMTVKSAAICIVISILIVIVGNTIIYFIRQASQLPDADIVLEQLQSDGFTDSYIHVDEKYLTRSIYVLDDAICIYEIYDNCYFSIDIKKDISIENIKSILLSVMRVFDKEFSSYDVTRILRLNEDDSSITINNIFYWAMFKEGKLDHISITIK